MEHTDLQHNDLLKSRINLKIILLLHLWLRIKTQHNVNKILCFFFPIINLEHRVKIQSRDDGGPGEGRVWVNPDLLLVFGPASS